jgi:pyruvate, water dikinase
MSWVSQRFCALFRPSGRKKSAPGTDQDLRNHFKTRYWNFKLLLDLNQRALEIVAGMEQQLKSGQGYGMSSIRSQATSLSVCVFQIIQKLESLAPLGKYAGLHQAFAEIQALINGELERHGRQAEGPLVLDLPEVGAGDVDWTGSKMAVLGEMANRLQLPVPDGFVVCSAGYQLFMEHNRLREMINKELQSAPLDDLEMLYEASREIQKAIISSELPDELRRELELAVERMEQRHGRDILVSMRSSALGEDGIQFSYAGQYRTELNVPLREAPRAYKLILAGKYSARAISYRRSRGMRDEDIRMSVGCMRMVQAVASGVAYSRDPGNPRSDRVLIDAAPGLGRKVVDGIVSPQSYLMGRDQDEWAILRIEEEKSPLGKAEAPTIDAEAAAEVARISRILENHFGTPQDIEWAIDQEKKLFLLQSRPLRALARPMTRRPQDPSPDMPRPLLEAGVCASPGAACGSVRIVSSREDAVLAQPGDVLVVENALPQWAVLLGKCAAVVSDHGGIASHLATVAREYRIPALFDTKGATRCLADGTIVTVDADGCRVYPGKADELLDAPVATRPDLMADSPVHMALERILKSITPLNLVDPEDHAFAPQGCRTYHDIIRFCHEQAVVEMFALGQDAALQALAGRQLKTDVPMQWWIVDLGDGVLGNVAPTVSLDELASIPFLAIWDGIVAVPWSGPPAPSVGGFFSAMANSTMNTDLDICGPSAMQQKNWAFVSRAFCSLNCRFGYHFSVIQAFVGGRSRENYIRFSFQGGATDRLRRAKRLELIRRVLSDAGFGLEIKGEALMARMEGYDEEHLLKRLKALGYLIIHTRQIDMAMNDAGKEGYYLTTLHDTVQSMIA